MSSRLILSIAMVAALASTALVATPAFAGGAKHSVSSSKHIKHAGGHATSRKVHATSRKVHVSHKKSGKSAGLGHHKSGKAIAGLGKKGGSTGKFNNGSKKQSSGLAKLGNGPGKLANGPGKIGTGAIGLANKKLDSANGLKMGPGAGKAYANKMGPQDATNPPAKDNKQGKNDNKQGKKNKSGKNDQNVVINVVPPVPAIVTVVDGIPPASVFSPGPRQLPPSNPTSADCIAARNTVQFYTTLYSKTAASLQDVQKDLASTKDVRDRRLAAATSDEERQRIQQSYMKDLADAANASLGIQNELRKISAEVDEAKTRQLEACI